MTPNGEHQGIKRNAATGNAICLRTVMSEGVPKPGWSTPAVPPTATLGYRPSAIDPSLPFRGTERISESGHSNAWKRSRISIVAWPFRKEAFGNTFWENLRQARATSWSGVDVLASRSLSGRARRTSGRLQQSPTVVTADVTKAGHTPPRLLVEIRTAVRSAG